MYELKLRGDGSVNHTRHSLNGGATLKYPRSYAELRSFARRHASPQARRALDEIEAAVAESGWKWVKATGGKQLEVFYGAATEVFNEVANATLGIEFESGPDNSLMAHWVFAFPIEDIVLDLLHRRHPTRRLLLVDGNKAVIRDGCGVRLAKTDAYVGTIVRAPSRSTGKMLAER